MIILSDPTRIGPALAEIRTLNGIARRVLARTIAERTGRTETSVNSQLWSWDEGHIEPTLSSLAVLLDELGYSLALIQREDDRG